MEGGGELAERVTELQKGGVGGGAGAELAWRVAGAKALDLERGRRSRGGGGGAVQGEPATAPTELGFDVSWVRAELEPESLRSESGGDGSPGGTRASRLPLAQLGLGLG
jgi:hypothetical protein